jgi:hypothetical protein
VITHDLKSCAVITDDGEVSDVVNDLLAEVQAARESLAEHELHHARVKELLVEVRRERDDLGLADIEEMIGKYMDRATISRITSPQLVKGTRKRTRKSPRS